jgi:hypothetical protein
MRLRFELEIALFRFGAVFVLQGTLYINRVGVVPFNEIAVVAVHRAHEIGQRRQHARHKAAPETGRFGGQLKGQIGQLATVPRAAFDQQRLHHTHRLAAIRDVYLTA